MGRRGSGKSLIWYGVTTGAARGHAPACPGASRRSARRSGTRPKNDGKQPRRHCARASAISCNPPRTSVVPACSPGVGTTVLLWTSRTTRRSRGGKTFLCGRYRRWTTATKQKTGGSHGPVGGLCTYHRPPLLLKTLAAVSAFVMQDESATANMEEGSGRRRRAVDSVGSHAPGDIPPAQRRKESATAIKRKALEPVLDDDDIALQNIQASGRSGRAARAASRGSYGGTQGQ